MKQNSSNMSLKQLEDYISSLKSSISASKDINDDLMSTFLINKQLLNVAFEKKCEEVLEEERKSAKALIQRLHKVEETNSELFQQRLSLDEEVLECKDTLEEEQSNHKTEVDELERKNAALTKISAQKEKQIKTLQNKMNKNEDKDKSGRDKRKKEKEKGTRSFIGLTPQTIEIHNELQTNRNIFKKFSKQVEAEHKKKEILSDYNRKLKRKNEELKRILRNIIKGFENFSNKKSQVLKSMNMEEVRALLDNEIEEPIILNEQYNRFKRADTTIPQRTLESEATSFAVCTKPGINKLGKKVVPMLDFTEINEENKEGMADKCLQLKLKKFQENEVESKDSKEKCNKTTSSSKKNKYSVPIHN